MRRSPIGCAQVTRWNGQIRRSATLEAEVSALFVLVHFFEQTKLDVTVPTFAAGLFTWLIGYRLAAWWWTASGELQTWLLLALTVAAAVLTFAGEAIGIGIAFDVSPLLVLDAAFNFDLDDLVALRPGWFVLAAGLCVVALDALRSRSRWQRQARPATRELTVMISKANSARLIGSKSLTWRRCGLKRHRI